MKNAHRCRAGRWLAFCLSFLMVTAVWAEVTVSGVSARQRYPWNGLVDVDFTLAGTDPNEVYHIEIEATDTTLNADVLAAKTLLTEPYVMGDGTHRLVWNLAADRPEARSADFRVTVRAGAIRGTAPFYLVVDLSGGPTATSYPYRYTATAPDLTDDTCRTDELWLRRCPAGTFTRGIDDAISRSITYTNESNGAGCAIFPPHTVKISKPFYIGVFELTQKQYYNLCGTWPSYFTNAACRATRPLENVAHASIQIANWYNHVRETSASTALGRLNNRTGLWFDLPTDAQWEYACKAGVHSYWYVPGVTTPSEIASYSRNSNQTKASDVTTDYVETPGAPYNFADDTHGTAKVGSFPPNPWGLYDMYGNVAERLTEGDPFGKPSSSVYFPAPEYFPYTPENPWVDPRSPSPEWAAAAGVSTSYSSAKTWRGGSWQLGVQQTSNCMHERVGSGAYSHTGYRFVMLVNEQ